MRRFERSMVLLALMAGLITAGCIGRVRQPEITLTGVKVSGLGLRGGTLLAELEIKNPNHFDVETTTITYDLKVSNRDSTQKENWIDFARGTFPDRVKLDAGSTTPVAIPIEFTYAAINNALGSIMERGTFNYRVEGIVTLREPLRTEVPYRHSGNISLQGVR